MQLIRPNMSHLVIFMVYFCRICDWIHLEESYKCWYSGTVKACAPKSACLYPDSTLCAALSLLLTSMRTNVLFPSSSTARPGVVKWVIRGLRSTFPIGLREVPLICWVGILLSLLCVLCPAPSPPRRTREAVNPPWSSPRPHWSSLPLYTLLLLPPLTRGSGGSNFHFPKSERRRAVICQFGLNGADSGLNVVFPPGCAIQSSRGGRGIQGAGVMLE